MSKPKFKVIKDSDNPLDSVIESVVKEKEWKTRFSVNDIARSIGQLAKTKTELESRKLIEEAKIANVKVNHPDIDLTIDPKIQVAYTVIQTAQAYITECDKKIGEIDEQLKEYAEDLEEIEKQVGIKLETKNNDGQN